MAKESQWSGDEVTALMINQAGKLDYVDNCGGKAPLTILQDDDDNGMWNALGGKYNSIMIVDSDGMLQHFIYPSAFPGSEEEIIDVVEGLLQ